ncbi:hypothetical protein P879_05083 [Paragonimus westermani]|uniref:Uncharacterized protein n=1 Tax=Paragonimus westermani TaxID=34504 RepID=A0A8T0DAI9_9TREM|nr:hypothetical protein P879_05083 [Paragonimus westermani]
MSGHVESMYNKLDWLSTTICPPPLATICTELVAPVGLDVVG